MRYKCVNVVVHLMVGNGGCMMTNKYLCDRCKHAATCEYAYDEYNRVINDDWTDDCLGMK